MTVRTFAVADHPRGPVLYDPAGGQSRIATDVLAPGLHRLEDTEVALLSPIEPAILGRDVPVSLCWSPLVRCNLSCPHCLDDKSLPEAGAAARARLASHIGESGVLGVDISGGEPLLLRDLPLLAARLVSGGCAVSVTTNGWHLARRIDDLAETVHAIRVSLDGADAAGHDRLRGSGSFDRALDGIRAARAAGVPVQLHTVVMASTLSQCQPMVDLAARLGVTGVSFLQMLPIGDGAAMAQDMLSDEHAAAHIAALEVPDGLNVRLRRRDSAAGFTVVRADGRIWRNDPRAETIAATRTLTHPMDLAITPYADGAA
ncbi:radical SAM protein [Nocardia takedensis]|uniref:radical SAM protein n=1 Tax=Nocardia takedensis TaxID=259390 RepID=UPI003F76555D